MRYGFINNFSQLLASDLAVGATTMTLNGGGSLLSAATADLVYTLTLDDGNGTTEIVHVTGQTTNDLTIVRAQEGTTAQAWPTGTPVEMRLTAGIAAEWMGLVRNGSNGSIEIGILASANLDGSTTLGKGASNASQSALVIVPPAYSYPSGDEVLGGIPVFNDASGAIVLGAGAKIDKDAATQYGYGEVVIGYFASSTADGECVVIGPDAYANGSDGNTAVGPYCGVSAGSYNTAAGYYSEVGAAVGAVGLGCGADTSISGGLRIPALSYLPTNPTPKGFLNMLPSAAPRAASQVSISTDALDLTSGTAAVTLDLPTGTRLFMDAIDVIITGSNTPGGTPQITVGPDDMTPATYLAATTVAKTAVGERETHTPLVTDGVTSLRVAVSTAGTGTTYTAKVVFRGYVMEL